MSCTYTLTTPTGEKTFDSEEAVRDYIRDNPSDFTQPVKQRVSLEDARDSRVIALVDRIEELEHWKNEPPAINSSTTGLYKRIGIGEHGGKYEVLVYENGEEVPRYYNTAEEAKYHALEYSTSYTKQYSTILFKSSADRSEWLDKEIGKVQDKINEYEAIPGKMLRDSYDIPDTFEGQRNQFAERWNLSFAVKEGEAGFVTKNGKAPTRALINKMVRQLNDRSGPLYDKLNVRYNATYGLIQIGIRERPFDASSPAYDISEGDTNTNSMDKQPRVFQQLSSDFKMQATDQSKYFVSASAAVKPDTYTSQGEYFNVDKQKTGNAKDLARQMGVSLEQLKETIKGSKLQPTALNDFINGKNSIRLTLYKVDRVSDPELFVNPNEDQTIGKLRQARVSQLKTLKAQIDQEKDPKKKLEMYKDRRRLEKQIKELNKPDNQNVGYLKKMFLDDKAAFEGKEYTDIRDVNRAINLFNGYEILFKSLDLAPFGEQVAGEFAQHQVEIKAIMENLSKLKDEVSLKQMELKTGAIFGTEDGLLPNKDIPGLLGYLLAMSTTANNPILRFIGKVTNFAVNKGADKAVAKKEQINKVLKSLVSWGKGVGLKGDKLYDYMLEEEMGADGKMHRTGGFVTKHGRFYSDLQKTLKDKDEKKRITGFMRYLRDNTKSIEIKDEDFKANREKIYAAMTEKVKTANPDFTPEEVHTLAESETSRIAYGIDPNNFMALVDKFSKGGKLEDKDIAFLNNFMDRRGYYDFIHLTPKDEFRDTKHAAIEAMADTDPRKQFYNLFTEMSYEARDGAASAGATLRRNHIAEYKRDYKDDDESTFEYLKDSAHDWVLHQLTESPRDNIQGIDPLTKEITRSIPFYAFDGRIKPEDKNYNLGKVIGVLAQQYYHYEALSEVEDELLMAQHLLKQTPVYKVNSFGKPVTINGESVLQRGDTSAIYKQADYHILSILYGEKMKKEVTGENPYYDAKTARRIAELDEIAKTRELDTTEAEEYRQLKNDSSVVTAKKFTNLLINWTSMKNIGFNIFGGAADFVRAMSSVYLRHGGKYWFNTLLPNTLTLFNPMDSHAKNKLTNLRKMFRIEVDPNENMESSKFKNVAFAAYSFSRNIANTSYLLATLKDQMVKDKDGKEHPLYDVMDFDQDGKIVMAPGFDNPFYNEKGEFSEYKYKLNQIIQKEIKMNRDRESAIDPIQLNQVWWGRLLGQFKASWLFEGLATRLMAEHEGLNDLDKATKGIYRGFWDSSKVYTTSMNALGETETRFSILRTIGKAIVNVAKYSVPGRLIGFGKKGDAQSQLDYEGAIRTVREIQMCFFLYGMAVMLSGMASGGNKGDWKKRGLIAGANFFMRSFRDVSTFGDIHSLSSFITQGAIPTLATVTQMTKVLADPFHGVFGGDWYYNQGKKDQSLKVVRDGSDLIPVMNQFRTTLAKLEKTQFNFY